MKRKPSLVRTYRDWSIADFAFTLLFTIIGVYGALHLSVRTDICEVLSSQPEIMRDLIEMGLSLENCEPWFEGAVVAFLAISIVILVARVCIRFFLASSIHGADENLIFSFTSFWRSRTITRTFRGMRPKNTTGLVHSNVFIFWVQSRLQQLSGWCMRPCRLTDSHQK